TTASPTQAHLFLRRVDPNLRQFGNPIQLTFDSDPVTARHITDHKHLFLNGYHFITFSVAGDSDLYIFKADPEGKRVGSIVPVVEHTANRTNDMMLATDGTYLYVAYFKPTQQSVVHVLNQDLQSVKAPFETSLQLPHNNLGTLFYKDDKFYMFTGTTAGPASSLILTVWNSDWSPAISAPLTLIPAPSNEGLAFATGIAFDAVRNYWIVGFLHMKNVNPDANTHIDFAVFDADFRLLEQQHHGSGYRPHFLLYGDYLYSVYDGGGVYLERYRLQAAEQPPAGQPVSWKPYFTLAPEEGTAFTVMTTPVVPQASVPALNATNAGKLVLTASGIQGLQAYEVSNDGKNYTPLTIQNRGADGTFIYLSDGRTRCIAPEPSPNDTQQKHRNRIVSWISSDGTSWIKETGIRFQPGVEDDSIAGVPSVIQVKDSLWRMYYVGDFYKTNGIRTAFSSDWGWTWQLESKTNILKKGDVDPHPVYLTDGRIRLYMRTGYYAPNAQSGIGYCESADGLHFDTTETRIVVTDDQVPSMLKCDPAVVKLPNGTVACYIGTFALPGKTDQEAIIVAWGDKTVVDAPNHSPGPGRFELSQNYPNPFNPKTRIRFSLWAAADVTLELVSVSGAKTATLLQGRKPAGEYEVDVDCSGFPGGIVFCRLIADGHVITKKMVLLK
ncbi:MAG TPA: hypothetical protein VGB38_07340, partial [bacterium]